MPRPSAALDLRLTERRALEAIAHASDVPVQQARRARAVLMAADGLSNVEIARSCAVTPTTVSDWRRRYVAGGVDALRWDRRGRRPPADLPDALVPLVLRATDPGLGADAHAIADGALTGDTLGDDPVRRHPWLVTATPGGAPKPAVLRVVGAHRTPSLEAVALGPVVAVADGHVRPAPDMAKAASFLAFLKAVERLVAPPHDIAIVLDRRSNQIERFDIDRWLANPKRSRVHVCVMTSPVAWRRLVAPPDQPGAPPPKEMAT